MNSVMMRNGIWSTSVIFITKMLSGLLLAVCMTAAALAQETGVEVLKHREPNISIPYPQRDVHLYPVKES